MPWNKWFSLEKASNLAHNQNLPCVSNLLERQNRQTACSRWQLAGQNMPLLRLERQLFNHPTVQLVCVCDASNRLVGLLNVNDFYHRLLYQVAPEELLVESLDHQNIRDYFDCVTDLTCGDIMSDLVEVKPGDPLNKLYETLRLHRLEIVPVTDDENRVVACLQLADLVSYWASQSQYMACK